MCSSDLLSPDQFRERGVETMAGYARSLGVSSALRFALSGDSLDRALELTRRLLSRGRAYEKLRSVYFDVSAQAPSRRRLRRGSRVLAG